MKNILIFGGTTEGRELAEILSENYINITLSVATDYGAKIINKKNDFLTLHQGRMDSNEIFEFLQSSNFDAVVDSTHPYAVEVTKNILYACKKANKKYIRLIREKSEIGDFIYVNSVFEASKLSFEGNVLLTTGSKEIAKFKNLNVKNGKIFARVLPTENAIKSCILADIKKERIIAEKGPFTYEENFKIMKALNIKNLVTKDGGRNGGFCEKLKAAEKLGINIIVIKRPIEEIGYSFNRVVEMFL